MTCRGSDGENPTTKGEIEEFLTCLGLLPAAESTQTYTDPPENEGLPALHPIRNLDHKGKGGERRKNPKRNRE